jgi:tricarballylate dehydrogenase
VYDTTDQEPEQSDTIEGLAEKLGLDPKELRKTVDEFNAALVVVDCACATDVDIC